MLRSEILGAVKMKCYLSGMPELRLGLNDKVMFETTGRATRGKAVEMEDVKFHQCVRLSRFENDRTISFIPPDGEFELMSYRLNTQVKPLIWVECVVESHSGSRIEYMLKVQPHNTTRYSTKIEQLTVCGRVQAKAQFKRRSTANNVEILVPVPEDADTPRFRTNIGSVHYAPEKSAIIWKIKQFGGGKEFLMRAELGLPSVKGDDEHGGGMTGGFGGSMGGAQGGKGKRPISVKFEIPYFTTSGIQVRYLKIIEPKVSAILFFFINPHAGPRTWAAANRAVVPRTRFLVRNPGPSAHHTCSDATPYLVCATACKEHDLWGKRCLSGRQSSSSKARSTFYRHDWLLSTLLTWCGLNSCNTHLYPGSATLHNLETSPSGYPMCNSGAGCGDWALHDLSKIGVLRIGMQTEWQYAGSR